MKCNVLLVIIVLIIFSINILSAQTGCENDIIPPEIVSFIGPQDPVELGSNVSVQVSFMDDCGNPHTALFDWKEINYPAPITLAEPENGQPGSIIGSHRYSFPGVYEVAMQIQDSFGNLAITAFKYVVVYDASAGFVTGGGWIDSPEGAYAPDPTLSGKANFGFVSKYKKGQTTPEGNTQFSFKVANLEFKSTFYDWLVISGPQAKFKGSGTINGSGDYGFMLTARDGQINGGGGVDRFRIKIWQKDANETIVYDNQMGDGDDADATDAIEGGSIVIHDTNQDLTPPVVIITSPFDGSATNQNPVTVSWMVDGVEQTTELSADLVEGTNQIIRSATDEAGNVGSDTISVTLDTVSPTVVITSPADGFITNETPITITWTVDGVEQTTELTADLVEGTNQIIRSATDEAGNVGSDTIDVTLDTVSPEVLITSPTDGFITNETPVTITWTVDGVEQTTELTADLVEGANQIIRSATDEAGNIGSDTINITLDTVSPEVVVTSPTDGFITTETLITITWTVDGVTQTTELTADLVEGANQIIRSATDEAGNIGSDTINVILDTISPVITVFSPDDESYTNQNTIQIVGNVFDLTEITLTVDGQSAALDNDNNFFFDYNLQNGLNDIHLVAQDAAGNFGYDTLSVYQDLNTPTITSISPANGTTIDNNQPTIEITFVDDLSGIDFSTLVVLLNSDNISNVFVINGNTATYYTPTELQDGLYTLNISINDNAGNSLSNYSSTFNIVIEQLPPDPATIAPEISPTSSFGLLSSVEFLFTGPNPIQTGVDSGTIDYRRPAVIRGIVAKENGDPLPGVEITINKHPEFGQTLSRADGWFDMVVNGGGKLAVNYKKTGYLPVQRQKDIPWQDYVIMDSVMMVQLDPNVTTINFSEPIEVAKGSISDDVRGSRQATLFFRQGTTARMILDDSTEVILDSIRVRATEYTVNDDNYRKMPAELPPSVTYTYCVELSTDEAIENNAKEVIFDQPVSVYVENFLGFTNGTPVPAAYYDYDKSIWVPMANGRIIKIMDVDSSGLATIDMNGDDMADDQNSLDSLDITFDEQEQLAVNYMPGASLWRVQVEHFSPCDFNWASENIQDFNNKFPADNLDDYFENGSTTCGSIIGIQNRNLGQAINISGTNFNMYYNSSKTEGYLPIRDIPLTNKSMFNNDTSYFDSTLWVNNRYYIGGMNRIDLYVDIAGKRYNYSHQPYHTITQRFVWDRRDAYGRRVYSPQKATITRAIDWLQTYTAPSIYALVRDESGDTLYVPLSKAFGYPKITTTRIVRWKTVRVHTPIIASSRFLIGEIKFTEPKFGGWTLDCKHFYNAEKKIIYYGNGTKRSASLGNSINTVADIAHLNRDPEGIAIREDGALYICAVGGDGGRVYLYNPKDASLTVFAGSSNSEYGENVPATQGRINSPYNIALSPDGDVYVTDYAANRIRKIDPEGIISTFAGNGETTGELGELVPATETRLNNPDGIAVGPDGSVYVSMAGHHRIRRIDPNGIISTYAGTGVAGFSGDSSLAVNAQISIGNYNYPANRRRCGLVVGPDGSLYIGDHQNGRIRKVSPDGIITTVAGGGTVEYSEDGIPATEAILNHPATIAVAEDGAIYFSDGTNDRVRKVTSDGLIVNYAGALLDNWMYHQFDGDGALATQAHLIAPSGIAIGHDNSVYISDHMTKVIRKIQKPLPSLALTDYAVSSEDGSEIYVFNKFGIHKSTKDAITGKDLFRFNYDEKYVLISITDIDNHITTFEYDSAGNLNKIISPFGKETTFEMDSTGYIGKIINPNGEANQFNYNNSGLMTTFKDAKGFEKNYYYNEYGRLDATVDAIGATKLLEDSTVNKMRESSLVSAEGNITKYKTEITEEGDTKLTEYNSFSDPTITITDKKGRTFKTLPDGSELRLTTKADPRFGSVSPITDSMIVKLPSGLTSVTTQGRGITQMVGDKVMGLIDTLIINGKRTLTRYDGQQNLIWSRSPMGKYSYAYQDSVGRVVKDSIPGILPVHYNYNEQGFLTSMTQGDRTTSFAYNSRGELETITDPLNRTSNVYYDSVGRVLRQVGPDSSEVLYEYDANGNLTSLTPPGKPTHSFNYTQVNLTDNYNPPITADSAGSTQYFYNLDRQIVRTLFPDSSTIDVVYDTSGCGCSGGDRPAKVIFDRGEITMEYDSTSGNLERIIAPGGETVRYIYDGSLTTRVYSTGTVNGNVRVNYNNDFKIQTQWVNGSYAADYYYDNDGNLRQYWSLYVNRDTQNGLPTGTSFFTISDTIKYNAYGEVNAYHAVRGSTNLLKTSYNMDDLGRITSLNETMLTSTINYDYNYDLAGRLKEVYKNSVLDAIYEYDANGNRLSCVTPSDTIYGVYDEQDRLLSYGNTHYGYTANGSLRWKAEGVDTTWYTYDLLGNLIEVYLPNGNHIEYVIDGNNRRIAKKLNGSIVKKWLYQDQLNPVAELNANDQIVARYFYGLESNVPDFMWKDGGYYRIISDHLGSVRLVVKTDGTIAQRLRYDAFGNVTTNSNPGFQPFGFAGGIYDDHTHMLKFGYRDYDSDIGRWLKKDPIIFNSMELNMYAYVENDPINNIDIMGFRKCKKSFWERTLRCLKNVNNVVPSVTIPGAIYGLSLAVGVNEMKPNTIPSLALGLYMRAVVAKYMNVQTVGQFLWQGVKSFGRNISWKAGGSAAIKGSAMSAVVVGLSFEGGLFLGSMISAGILPCEEEVVIEYEFKQSCHW